MQHLLILDYRTDAERKRLDYLIGKWGARPGISVTKPRGVTVLFDGDGLEEFVEDVRSRQESGADPPAVFALEASSPEIERIEKRLEFFTARSTGTVADFLGYLMAKQGAGFEYSKGDRQVYTARTRKGNARIEILLEGGKKTRCLVTVDGFGDAAGYVAGRIQDEMTVFLGGE